MSGKCLKISISVIFLYFQKYLILYIFILVFFLKNSVCRRCLSTCLRVQLIYYNNVIIFYSIAFLFLYLCQVLVVFVNLTSKYCM